MFENIINIFKRARKVEMLKPSSKDAAKERLHLVLMQDRANVSADFLDLMRVEIIEVIKKYIDIDEDAMVVKLTNETGEDGVQGAPTLHANIPIINIKDETRKLSKTNQENKINQEPPQQEEKKEEVKEEKDEAKDNEKTEEVKIEEDKKQKEVQEEKTEVKPKESSKKDEKTKKPQDTTKKSEKNKEEKQKEIKEEKKNEK